MKQRMFCQNKGIKSFKKTSGTVKPQNYLFAEICIRLNIFKDIQKDVAYEKLKLHFPSSHPRKR